METAQHLDKITEGAMSDYISAMWKAEMYSRKVLESVDSYKAEYGKDPKAILVSPELMKALTYTYTRSVTEMIDGRWAKPDKFSGIDVVEKDWLKEYSYTVV